MSTSVRRAGLPGGPGLALLALALATGCQADQEHACDDAEARLGHRVCVHRVPSTTTWDEITFPAAAVDQARVTNYLVPARGDARVPTVFIDANAFPDPEQSLHLKFLTDSFPDFETLDYMEYYELITDPDLREWYAGSIAEIIIPGEEHQFGFSVADGGADPNATLTCGQFKKIYEELNRRMKPGPLVVMPMHDLQRQTLEDCGLPVYDWATALDYEPYTKAAGCGTLRRYTLAELAAAETQAAFGWQDVLVVNEAPLDIETIISGIVTGTRQGELSHLNVRSASRGTPNCYVKDAYELLADLDGELVRLDCGPDQATVAPITPEEAEACWADLKPDPVDLPPPDLSFTDLVPLLDVPTATADDRALALSRFGSKGSNLATLYQRIDPALQLQGFLIPFHYYDAFLDAGSWMVDVDGSMQQLTFRETLTAWLADPVFQSDGVVRRDRLLALQAAMEVTPCDPDLVTAIGVAMQDTWGNDTTMVRFRSSSNAEDSLEFNGAGLYDSTSVCLADETDGDILGPSACDADQTSERDVCRGLTKVWASLWSMKAYEERDWYGMDHTLAVMGILVDTRTKGELANVVAFSGNPLLQGDDRYLINAQLGELDVVAAVAGVWPEKDLLTIEGGMVVEIERARGSTELPEGQWVLDDARLEELGAALADIVEVYPIDAPVPPSADVLLDTEWKIRGDGQLIIKQVRPFLD